MARAPWPVGLLFGLGLAVLIALAGPLLLFNPWFTSALQQRHEVAAAFDTTQVEVERVTASYLADIYLDGSFEAGFDGQGPLLDDAERSHVYTAAVPETSVKRRLVADLLDRAFDGSAAGLVMQALSARRASPDELREIRKLLDSMRGDR